jgi:hypothetical protein
VEIISRLTPTLTLIHDPSTVHAGKLKMCKMLQELIHSLFKGKERRKRQHPISSRIGTISISPLLHATEVARVPHLLLLLLLLFPFYYMKYM